MRFLPLIFALALSPRLLANEPSPALQKEMAALGGQPREAFENAVRIGRLDLARQILTTYQDQSALLVNTLVEAIRDGDAKLVKTLLGFEKVSPLDPRRKEYLLSTAAKYSNGAVVKVLLAAGIDPGTKALEAAADTDNAETLRALIAGGADGMLALRIAFDDDAEKSVLALAEDLLFTPYGRSVSTEGGARGLARRLLEVGIDSKHHRHQMAGGQLDVDARDEKGRTGLMQAAATRDGRLFALYLRAGADVDARDREGKTPLVFAAGARSTEMMVALRKAGASEENGSGKSPAEVFWSAFPLELYQARDPQGPEIRLRLPQVFNSGCHGSGNAEAVYELSCAAGLGFGADFTVSRIAGARWLAWLMPKNQELKHEATVSLQEDGKNRWYQAVGRKGSYQLTVVARGADGLEPETERLAQIAWENATLPLETRADRRWRAVIVIAVLGALIALLVAQRRQRKERERQELE